MIRAFIHGIVAVMVTGLAVYGIMELYKHAGDFMIQLNPHNLTPLI